MSKILIMIFVLTSVWGHAQSKLSIVKIDSLKKRKSIEFTEGSRIDISYFKSIDFTANTRLKNNLHLVSGKLKGITLDTLIVKKFLSKKTVSIPVNSVFQVRRPTHLAVISSITTVTCVGGYFISESIGYYFLPSPLQWMVLPLAYVYIDQRVLNPMKTVNEEFYQRNNEWLMTIEQVK